jgi:hypothetical protein
MFSSPEAQILCLRVVLVGGFAPRAGFGVGEGRLRPSFAFQADVHVLDWWPTSLAAVLRQA